MFVQISYFNIHCNFIVDQQDLKLHVCDFAIRQRPGHTVLCVNFNFVKN